MIFILLGTADHAKGNNNIITITRWLTYLRSVIPGILIWRSLILLTGTNISSNRLTLCSRYSKRRRVVLYKGRNVWPGMYFDKALWELAICEWPCWYGTVPNCPSCKWFNGVLVWWVEQASWSLEDGVWNCTTGSWLVETTLSQLSFWMIVSDPDCEAVALCLDCLLPVQDKWVSYRTERK